MKRKDLYSNTIRKALFELIGEKFPLTKAKELANLMDFIQIDLEKSQKLSKEEVKKYSGKIEGTKFIFNSPEDEVTFQKVLDDYMEEEVKIEKIILPVSKVKPIFIKIFEGLIIFESDSGDVQR